MSEETYDVLVKYLAENASILKEGHFLFVNIKNKTTGIALSRWEAGWNLFMIANALNHKSIRTTELYLQLSENSRLEVSAK